MLLPIGQHASVGLMGDSQLHYYDDPGGWYVGVQRRVMDRPNRKPGTTEDPFDPEQLQVEVDSDSEFGPS